MEELDTCQVALIGILL